LKTANNVRAHAPSVYPPMEAMRVLQTP